MAELKLFDLEIYKLSHYLGNKCWELSSNWKHFEKDTLGRQLVRAADSVSLNFCEGYGRFHFNDRKIYCYYSRGSLYETIECLRKAKDRNLITEEDYNEISKLAEVLGIKLNNFIKSLKTNSLSH
jgi:four helix bundle protein